MEIKDLNKELVVPSYASDKDEQEVLTYKKRRAEEMQAYRASLNIEQEWREADNEYLPTELNFGTGRKRFETDQTNGLRSRMVPVGDASQDWRSNNSAPTLLSKIQTAFSILIDNDPDAALTAMGRMFEKRTDIAKAVWKRNWQVSGGKENLKKFAFNLLKYGWSVGRTYPCVIKYDKEVLIEVDTENPEKNKYETKELTWYNDVQRQTLDPYTTWIDEQTKPYEPYSMNDCYYEIDYSYDQATIEFGRYPNWKYVPKSAKQDNEIQHGNTALANRTSEPDLEATDSRKDIVTIGFYQNRAKDLYVIDVPSAGVLLYYAPLPNDDGMLDLWHTLWVLRDNKMPYGVSLWRIIRQDKWLYDKMNNMTMDQLVLSIMKFGFYTGTSQVLGDGTIAIVPGQARQIVNGEVKWMEIPGPGKDSYEGLKMLQSSIDDNSGITPTIEGEITGKTLGETQLARESSLKRLKTPLENIAWGIEQDVYLTLSWSKQTLSTPEVKKFVDQAELDAYQEEMGVMNGGVNQQIDSVTGLPGEITAQFYPEVALHLEERDGSLYESEKSKFFQIGVDLQAKDLNWRGIVKVIAKSLVGNSEIIMQQTKMQMFNIIVPLLTAPPELMKKPVEQILKIHDEDPKEWLPDSWLNPQPPMMPGMVPQAAGGQPPLFVPAGGGSMQNQAGGTPQQAQSVVPRSQVSGPAPKNIFGGLPGMFKK